MAPASPGNPSRGPYRAAPSLIFEWKQVFSHSAFDELEVSGDVATVGGLGHAILAQAVVRTHGNVTSEKMRYSPCLQSARRHELHSPSCLHPPMHPPPYTHTDAFRGGALLALHPLPRYTYGLEYTSSL